MTPFISECKALLHNPIVYLRERPLLVGSATFFLSSTTVNLGNYVFNIIMGRWLGPALFADISLIITLMLITTFMTTALSTTIAWFIAVYAAEHDLDHQASVRAWSLRNAYRIGGAVALVLISGSVFFQHIFHMRSFWPFILLGLGFPIFFALAVERGLLQGRVFFGWLSLSAQAEMWTRLLGSIVVVLIGWSINGIAGIVSFSFFVAWLVARHARQGLPLISSPLTKDVQRRMLLYFRPVIIGLMGQIIINNSDILIVKSFFPSREAGLYAALALVGRIVYFATWSIVIVMFPIIAQKYQRNEEYHSWLWIMCGFIILISGGIVLVTLFLPNQIIRLLFGDAYLPIAPLLWLYALATAFYTLANGITNYYLSLNHGLGNYIVLCAALAQVIGLLLFHQNLLTVVLVQVVLMACLLLTLLLWHCYIEYISSSSYLSNPDAPS